LLFHGDRNGFCFVLDGTNRELHLAKAMSTRAMGRMAKRRRMNWEESNNLGLVPKDVLDAII
jgi:hypothetical protein